MSEMSLTLRVWRQEGPNEQGELREYQLTGVSPNASFLQMMDLPNEAITPEGKALPITPASDHPTGRFGKAGPRAPASAPGPRRAVGRRVRGGGGGAGVAGGGGGRGVGGGVRGVGGEVVGGRVD